MRTQLNGLLSRALRIPGLYNERVRAVQPVGAVVTLRNGKRSGPLAVGARVPCLLAATLVHTYRQANRPLAAPSVLLHRVRELARR